MKIAIFDSHEYEAETLGSAFKKMDLKASFFNTRLDSSTVQLATGHDAVCCFVSDNLSADVLHQLKESGIEVVALRCAGFNNLDFEKAKELDFRVVRVPSYSPHAVAEHTLALLLTLNRKVHKAYARVRELNFSLNGLTGFDLYQKTVGVIGTGKIGAVFSKMMLGLGCRVIAFDPVESSELVKQGVEYVGLDQLFSESDVISLHAPLSSETKHLIDGQAFSKMKTNVILLNTSRGALIDTKALIQALKSERIGGAALDVYEEEEGVFFEDHSAHGINDDVLARLMTFPNVLMTSHQAFLTTEALKNIATTTATSLAQIRDGNNPNQDVVLV